MKPHQKKLLEDLKKLTKSMSVPEHKIANPAWLVKNLAKENIEHASYNEVISISKQLLSEGIAHG